MNEQLKNLILRNKITIISLSILIIIVGFFAVEKSQLDPLTVALKAVHKNVASGKIAKALMSYDEMVRKYPESYDVHYEYGILLSKVDEIDKAKIEFFRAIKLGEANKYQAHFAMADLYTNEGNYPFAEQLLLSLKGSKFPEINEKLGDFYFNWAKKTFKHDQFEAIRKYKLAYSYFKNAHYKKLKEIKLEIEKTYVDVASQLVSERETDDAIKLLESLIKVFDNAAAHFKLGKIYENINIDKAISEYEIAYKLNKEISDKSELAQLLIKKGNIALKSGNTTESDLYFTKAENISRQIDIPNIDANNILVNIVTTKYYEDIPNDILIPGLSFRIMNVSKEDVNYLKVKIVFWEAKHVFNEVLQDVSTLAEPLKADTTTDTINILSSKSLKQVFAKHDDVKIQIFVSQTKPDKWKLYRNAYLSRDKSSSIYSK